MTLTAPLNKSMTPSEARRQGQALLDEHGLIGWNVVFDNARRRAGQCNYRTREISLSRYLMLQRSYEDTMMTISHEVAHALVGAGHGHDAVWARQHRALGGNGKRCFETSTADQLAPWLGTCGHGKEFARYRRPKRLEGWTCRCSPSPSPITWEKKR